MTVQMPRRRDQRLGKNISKIPNRTDVQRIGPASDPGARGGPTNVPLGAFGGGEGLESAGKAITASGISQLEEIQKEQAKIEQLEAKIQDDTEKNKNAKNITNFNAVTETLNKTFDWAGDYGEEDAIDVYTKKFTENHDKFAPLADTFSEKNKLDYNSKLHGARIKASLLGSENQRTAIDTENINRIQNKFNEFYIQRGGTENSKTDPTIGGFIPILVELAEENKGSLHADKVRTEVEKYIVFAFQERVAFLSDITKSGLATNQADEITSLTDRLRLQYPDALNSSVIKETTQAVREIRDTIAKRTDKGMEIAETRRKEDAFLAGIKELRTKYPNYRTEPTESERYAEEKNDLREALGMTRVSGTKLSPGETVTNEIGDTISEGNKRLTNVGPGGKLFEEGTDAPVAVGAPIVKPIPDKGSLAVVDPKSGDITSVDFNAPEIQRPNYIDEDGSFNVNGETLVSQRMEFIFGSDKDAAGNPVGLDDAGKKFHVNLTGAIAKKAQEHKNGEYTYRSISEVISAVFKELKPEDIPKSFNLNDIANEIVADIDNISHHAKTFEWGKKANSEIVNDVQKDLEIIERDGNSIELGKATGWASGLADLFGSAFGSIFDSAVSEEVTMARFQYGLLVRDFVREFTLSPRFAVKEQELLRSMFPGPGVWNAPKQAAERMRQFDQALDKSIQNNLNIIRIKGGATGKQKLEALQDLRFIVGMKNRLGRFNISGLENASATGSVRVDSMPLSRLVEHAKNNPEFLARLRRQHTKQKENRQPPPQEVGGNNSGAGNSPPVKTPPSPVINSSPASDLSLVDLETMSLEEAGQTLAKMPVEEIFKRWEGTPPEIRDKWALKLDHLIADALNRPADIDYTGVESEPKKVKKKKGKKK